jgi:uncharacterized protein YcbX
MVATIRALGTRPCPRCLVKKVDLDQMGRPEDMDFREAHQRVDNEERQAAVNASRVKVYEEGYVVGSSKVEDLLKTQSLHPVKVGPCSVLLPLHA